MASVSMDPVTKFATGEFSIVDLLNNVLTTANPSNTVAEIVDTILYIPRKELAPRLDALTVVLGLIHEHRMLQGTSPNNRAEVVNQVAQAQLPQPALVPVERVAQCLPSARSLHAGALLSQLLSTQGSELSEEVLASLKATCQENEPLEVTLKAKAPGLARSLMKAQEILGKPVVSLKVEYTTFDLDDLVGIISSCPSLKKLSINNSRTVTDEVVEQAAWPKHLEVVTLQGTSITANGLQMLVTRCSELKSLDVRGCDELSSLELAKIAYPKTLVDFSCDPFWKKYKKILDKSDEEKIAQEKMMQEMRQVMQQPAVSPIALTIGALALLEHNVPEKEQARVWLEQARAIQLKFVQAGEIQSQSVQTGVALAELLRTGALDVKQAPLVSHAIVDELLQAHPEHPRIQAAKARLLLCDGHCERAHSLAHAAYKQAPNDDFVLATLAEISRREGNPGLATLSLRALKYNPRNVYAMTSRANFIAHMDIEEASKLYKQALAINFHDQAALVGLGHYYVTSKNEKLILEGKKNLEEAVKANPDAADAHFALAKLYLYGEKGITKDSQLALYHLEEAYRSDPTNVVILTTYGDLLRTGRKGILIDIPKAITLLRSALEHDPLNYAALITLASILMDDMAGDEYAPRKAQELCEEAYRQEQDDPFLLSMLGDLYTRNDGKCAYEPERGVELLESAIEESDDSVYAQLMLANFFVATKDPERAEEHLKNALKQDPEYVLANTARAKFEMTRADYEKAQKYVSRALEIDSKNPEALYLQARIYVAANKAEALNNANATLETLLATNYGQQTRQDIAILLTENPLLLGEKRQEVLKHL